MIAILAGLLVTVNGLAVLRVVLGPPEMVEVSPAPQPWWNSPPFSVSWNGRRFPQEHDVWPWWRPGT